MSMEFSSSKCFVMEKKRRERSWIRSIINCFPRSVRWIIEEMSISNKIDLTNWQDRLRFENPYRNKNALTSIDIERRFDQFRHDNKGRNTRSGVGGKKCVRVCRKWNEWRRFTFFFFLCRLKSSSIEISLAQGIVFRIGQEERKECFGVAEKEKKKREKTEGKANH